MSTLAMDVYDLHLMLRSYKVHILSSDSSGFNTRMWWIWNKVSLKAGQNTLPNTFMSLTYI